MSTLKVNAIKNLANQEPFGLTLMTQVTASGTAVDFTGIPSWAKRITIMFSNVSSSATSNYLIQIGSGSLTTTGYTSTSASIGNAAVTSTAGFIATYVMVAANSYAGSYTILNVHPTLYVGSGTMVTSNAANNAFISGGSVTLSGALDRVRITTVNGTDTFDAGTINIMYE